MPARFAGLELYNGWPIPVTVNVVDGVPDFRVVDLAALGACLRNRLCSVCGSPLDYWIVFVGGPESIKSRVFLDGPMHEECARWSMANCPFLVGKVGYSDESKRPPRLEDDAVAIVDDTIHDRPDRMGMGVTRNYRAFGSNGRLFIQASPFKRIEWFHD